MNTYARIITEDDPKHITKELADRVAEAASAYLSEHEMSQYNLAKSAGVAASTLSMFLAGSYAGDWRAMAGDLDLYLERQAELERSDRLADYVPTRISEEIIAVGELVKERGGIGLIHGDSGVGKTTALRTICHRTPHAIYISAATAKARMKGLLVDISLAMGRCVYERTLAETFNRVAATMRFGCDLLIVDEIHKYCGRDDCFDVLRDLLDNTGKPQIWAGTTDLIRYFDRKMAQGREPLAQIRRRILIARDLNDTAAAEGGSFNAAEIRKILASGCRKLDNAAVRYMLQLANARDEGALGLVKNLYATAATMAARSNAGVITVELLRTAHGLQASQRTRRMVDSKLEIEASSEADHQGMEARQRATA